jgi:hypothetical protein
MYCWIEPPNGYSICIHTSFGGYAEGSVLVAKPKMRGVLLLIAPVVVRIQISKDTWQELLLALCFNQLSLSHSLCCRILLVAAEP